MSRVRILGGGIYGCHVALALMDEGHDVEIHEIADRLFAGASGNIPARLHQGFHYPRSRITRAACQDHQEEFLCRYGFLTHGIPINIYAIAADESMLDYAQYLDTLSGEVDFIPLHDPREYGLQNVEGAVLTGERHIICDFARDYFLGLLKGHVRFGVEPGLIDDPRWDMTIDCTFAANNSAGVDRYEPCLTLLMEGPVDKAVTIMDGPFPSLYVWREDLGLSSLTSAQWTPFSKACKTWAEARALLDGLGQADIHAQATGMIRSMAHFFPEIQERYELADYRLSIRAMPLSGADTRLIEVVRVGERALRVRAGKIDAVIQAERAIKQMMGVMV